MMAPLGRDKLKVYRPLCTIEYVVDPVSYLTFRYQCKASTPGRRDAGTLAPMIDKTERIVGGALRAMFADVGYCSILDLRDAAERNVELLAPVPPTEARRSENRPAVQSKFLGINSLTTKRAAPRPIRPVKF